MKDQELAIWNDENTVKEIKEIYGKDLTDTEFKILLGIGKATRLNPFLREIWAVKYGTAKASIFIGRDGYRKSAQANPDYDYHLVDAVYQNDTFSIDQGEVKHTYNLQDRGEIRGAYCIVKRKSSSRPHFLYVDFKEYYAGHKDENGKVKTNSYGAMKPTLWDTKQATMIKKVAEAQTLRMTFQELFAGTYSETEKWEADEDSGESEKPAKTPKVVKTVTTTVKKENDDVITEAVVMINQEQAESINRLLKGLRLEGKEAKAYIESIVEREIVAFTKITSTEADAIIKVMNEKFAQIKDAEGVNLVDPSVNMPKQREKLKPTLASRAMSCATQEEADGIMGEAKLTQGMTEVKMTAIKNIMIAKGLKV